MRNFWLIARYEYSRLARRRSFLFSTLGFPLLLSMVIGVGIWTAQTNNSGVLGYVDKSGLLSNTSPPENVQTPMREYGSRAQAERALEAGEISAVYFIPADYLQSHTVTLLYREEPPGSEMHRDFGRFLRAALVMTFAEPTRHRLLAGAELSIHSADGERTLSEGNFADFLVPFAAAMLFAFAAISSSGYLLQVVTDEKENRTMEMLLTSLRPLDLIGGKTVGLMALTLTQLGIWATAVAIGAGVGSIYWEPLQAVTLSWDLIGVVVIYFLPSYMLIAGMMTAIGSAVTDVRQGHQIAGILNLLFIAPLFVLPILIEAPNSPLPLVMTFFPTTALMTTVMRWALSYVPTWQLLLSQTVLWTSALLSLWLAVRVFQIGRLEYGQPLSLRTLWVALGRPQHDQA